jgi:hypothetical protein
MEYFSEVLLDLEFLDTVYKNLDHSSFKITPTKQLRLEFRKEIKDYIQNFIPFKIDDCGIFKNPPGWIYPIHRDKNRTCAINILICEEDPDFEIKFYEENTMKSIFLPYKKEVPYLLNTKKLHGVINRSRGKTRLVLTIGNSTDSYEDVLKIFKHENFHHNRSDLARLS